VARSEVDERAGAGVEPLAFRELLASEQTSGSSSGGGSRSDGFWATLGKTIVRTGVPMATRILESALKSKLKGGRGGGFSGLGALDAGEGQGRSGKSSNRKTTVGKKDTYVPFQTIPSVRGILGGRTRKR
jgi:hypothetical protein